jgi:hypothetical protein
MSSLLLDFHSIISVWAPDLPQSVQRPFRRHFQPFLSEPHAPPAVVDVTVEPMAKRPQSGTVHRRFNALLGYAICFYQGEPAVALLRHGQPDIMVQLADTIRVYYRPRRGIEHRLYGVVLLAIYLAARLKGRLVLHGAVVEREGRGLLIAGHRGSGKTPLLLTFLQHGWNYVTDDKFLLDGNQACSLEPLVAISDHHYQVIPWLERQLPGSAGERLFSQLAGPVRSLVTNWAPRRLQPPLQRRLAPVRLTPVQTLVPGCKLSPGVTLNSGFILLCGERMKILPESPETAAAQLQSIYDLMHLEASAMEQLLLLYPGRTLPPVHEVISQFVADVPFAALTLPAVIDPEEAYNAMMQHHAQY